MTNDDVRDPRTGTRVGPDRVVDVRDQTVIVPDAPPPPAPAAPRRRMGVGSNTAMWVIGALVALIVVVAIFIWALAPDEDGAAEPAPDVAPPVTDTIQPDSGVGTGLALAAPDELRTHTVNVAGDQDLLSLATTAGAIDTFGGAPVTADGVEVTQLLGERAFEVTNPAGQTIVVYLPYGVPGDVFVQLAQQISFVGSVSPTSEDLTFLASSEAATAAAGDGAFIIAVPESVHILPNSNADEVEAA